MPGFLADDVIKAAKKRRTEPATDAAVVAAVRAANAAQTQPQPDKKAEPGKK